MIGTRTRDTTIHGVLLLDKSEGPTSNAALQQVRRLYGYPKAGHTGTLDPLATGLLAICFGEATKFADALLGAEKRYLATVQFGFRSSTGDAGGAIARVALPRFTLSELKTIVVSLTGEIEQIPPMFSAIKLGGRPLYERAYKGETVERAPRKVVVSEIQVLDFGDGMARLNIRCSKGTYIRTLVEDLGKRLGCGAYLAGLRRTGIGLFDLDAAIPLEALEIMAKPDLLRLLRPIDALLSGFPRLELGTDAARKIRQGQKARTEAELKAGLVRLYGPGGQFIGIGEYHPPESIVPKRLVMAGGV